MALAPLTAADMEASLHVWLETEFTYFKVEQLAIELAQLAREEQDFILGWIRRIASPTSRWPGSSVAARLRCCRIWNCGCSRPGRCIPATYSTAAVCKTRCA